MQVRRTSTLLIKFLPDLACSSRRRFAPPVPNVDIRATKLENEHAVTNVETVEVSTLVYLPPAEVYEFLIDFPRYAKYSEYMRNVDRYGDGSPGTEYDITIAWWLLEHTVRSRVTDVDPPGRIDWELVSDVDAEGCWRIEPQPDAVPEDEEHATRVWLTVACDLDSVEGAVGLPAFVSLEWLIEKVAPKVEAETRETIERIVTDLEGQRREVELTIHQSPSVIDWT